MLARAAFAVERRFMRMALGRREFGDPQGACASPAPNSAEECMQCTGAIFPPPCSTACATGVVIPAHPLALDANRQLDRGRQSALTRYYIDAGAGGLAVGVHTTQFAIREVGLYEPVLRTRRRDGRELDRPSADA